MEHEDRNAELDSWLVAYRDACPEPEPSVNFMPELWAKIEARQISTNLFGRMAKALVTAALAATVILGMISTIGSQPDSSFTGTYLEALSVDQATTLEPFNLDRVSELEQQ
ncbi:MAG TPA: hypothetical protein VKB79_16320 [Bryobacteraceae bacterium]|nr:hypothetical protein [Bryobacteraceae bacterium]